MEIYTVIIDDESRLTFKKKYSRYQLVFQIRLEGDKPKLRGYWSGYGGFGGGLDMSEKDFTNHCAQCLEHLIEEQGADTIAAFIAEPILGPGGIVPPPKNYWNVMMPILERNDILLIADEVVTGFGRMGHIFASEKVFGIIPDIITFAKGVTSGYFPLGGIVISNKLIRDLRSSNHADAMFGHGLTYSSHPIGCAVAIKNIELMENGVLENALELGPIFQEQLKLEKKLLG